MHRPVHHAAPLAVAPQGNPFPTYAHPAPSIPIIHHNVPVIPPTIPSLEQVVQPSLVDLAQYPTSDPCTSQLRQLSPQLDNVSSRTPAYAQPDVATEQVSSVPNGLSLANGVIAADMNASQPATVTPSAAPTVPTTSTMEPSANTNTLALPAHLTPSAQPNFDWNYIWSFFARAPRVRAWLFEKDPPPATHVVQSLLSSPMLVGYIFGTDRERHRLYAFPDIGDLQTVYCRDGDAFLGFNFGFQGVQPIMPLLFQVIKDPMLANPTVRVRRTARQRAPPPYQNYYLSIEFTWFESGALGVITSVLPVDPEAVGPTGLCPYVLCGDHRIFNSRTAARLSSIAESLSRQVDLAFFPDPSHFVPLPPDFVDPPDNYYYLTLREPDDPMYHATLQPAYVPEEHKLQTFHVEREIPDANTPVSTTTANSSSTSATSNTGSRRPCDNNTSSSNEEQDKTEADEMQEERAGASVDSDKGDVTSLAEKGTIALWKRYQTKVAQSRRTGIIITMLGKKHGLFAERTPIFGREAKYVFLSTNGINVHGRIQRLCTQLGIQLSSPLPDQLLSTSKKEDVNVVGKVNANGDIDISHAGSGVNENMERRRFEQGLDNALSRANMMNYSALAMTPNSYGESEPWVGRNGPALGSVLDDAAVLANGQANSPDGKGSPYGGRHPKRRRCGTPNDLNQASHVKQPLFTSPHSTQGPPDQILGNDIERIAPVENSNLFGIAPPPEDSGRHRSFDLDHILSNDNGMHGSELVRKNSPESIQDVPRTNELPAVEIMSSAQVATKGAAPEGESPKSAAEPPKGKGNKTVWTCDRCGVQIRGKKGNLNRHIANKHDNIRAFACKREGCGRRFQTRLNLVRHETAVHEGRPFTCPSCPRAFKYEDDLKAHIKSAHDEPDATLACEVCGSCFGRRSTLNRHMAKVHKSKPQGTAQAVNLLE